ncbi:MAG: KdsC family phosphatase [Bacteroidota bacterium]|jgi:3-deoxy-D-manno-octulosonate 8-phosphate phosphatase (KDO 8-P phosphatase)
MIHLEQNIKGLCTRHGLEFDEFMNDLEVDHVHELTLFDLQAICEEYTIDLQALLFKPMYRKDLWSKKTEKIKLLVMDVDGVMTDGGMYITEKGDHIKKYNTKDGMAIQHLRKFGIEPAIISSGFMPEMVRERARMLKIEKCHIGREPKLTILKQFCDDLGITLDNVALIGDDINDLEMIRKVGLSACPSDAVNMIKTNVDIILSKKGGEGCIRELIDSYLLNEPLTE